MEKYQECLDARTVPSVPQERKKSSLKAQTDLKPSIPSVAFIGMEELLRPVSRRPLCPWQPAACPPQHGVPVMRQCRRSSVCGPCSDVGLPKRRQEKKMQTLQEFQNVQCRAQTPQFSRVVSAREFRHYRAKQSEISSPHYSTISPRVTSKLSPASFNMDGYKSFSRRASTHFYTNTCNDISTLKTTTYVPSKLMYKPASLPKHTRRSFDVGVGCLPLQSYPSRFILKSYPPQPRIFDLGVRQSGIVLTKIMSYNSN